MNVAPVPPVVDQPLWRWLVEVREELVGALDESDFDTWFAGKTTTGLAEGGNLYYTDARVDSRVNDLISKELVESFSLSHSALEGLDGDHHLQYHTDDRALTWIQSRSTSDVPEGSNLYFTAARALSAVRSSLTTDDVAEGTINFYWTDSRFNTRFDARLATKTTGDIVEGVNLYYTEARVDANRKDNILEYGYEEVTASATVTKTKTVFSGSTASQTITLPTVGTSGGEVEVFNTSSVTVSLSGSSVLSELYPNESACFIDTGSDWIA